MPSKHALQTAIADNPAYDVSKDEWNAPHVSPYAPGSFTVATETADLVIGHLKLTGTQRVTLEGTATLRLI